MIAPESTKSSWIYAEIGQNSLKVRNGQDVFDFPLDRQDNGRLTNLCREQLARSLQASLKRKRWQPRLRALCAIGARGVSMRRLTLPSASNEEFQRLLRLQIESEFPLPPDQLAWGYRRVRKDGTSNAVSGQQELIVVAVKKELIEEYAAVFAECGVNPVFTLAAFTRDRIYPQPNGSYAVLEVGESHSEWVSFENGAPNSLRILPWGTDSVTRSIEQRLGISHGDAEKLRVNLDPRNVVDQENGQRVQSAVDADLDALAASIRSAWSGQRIFLTGKSARDLDLAPRLVKRLGDGASCDYWETTPDEDRSAAILRLDKNGGQGTEPGPLLIQVNETRSGEPLSRPAPWKWAAMAGLLAIGLVSLPYVETFLMKSRLSRRLAALKVEKQRLPEIDRELRFLQYLKENQPPYLDALAIVANAAQPGTRFDSVSMNRRGDLALRGFMRDSQQVVDFRTKLIKSSFFSTVVVEEQNPTPDRQKVNLRISAQWKTAPGREAFTAVPPTTEMDKPKTAGNESKTNAPPKTVPAGPVASGSVDSGPVSPRTNPPPKP